MYLFIQISIKNTIFFPMEFLFSSSHFKSIYNIHMSTQHTRIYNTNLLHIYCMQNNCIWISFLLPNLGRRRGVSLGNYTIPSTSCTLYAIGEVELLFGSYRIPYKVYYKVFDMFTKIQIISYISMYILENSYSNSLLSFSYLDKFSIWIAHLYI